MKIVEMRQKPTEESEQSVLDVLELAQAYATDNPCDEIVIVMQRVDGSAKPWFASDESTAATMMFMLQTMLFQLQCMVCGIRLG